MAKQSMIQREKKRERLIAKHLIKRESLKTELKNVTSFQERLTLYKKFESYSKKFFASSPQKPLLGYWS
jgi:hypothetical protein